MSTFTTFNGPQGGMPSTKALLELVEAYNQLSVQLREHISDKVPGDTEVHGVMSHIKDVKERLEQVLATKATDAQLKEVRDTAEAAATNERLAEAVRALEEAIAAKADASALDTKTDTVVTTAVREDVELLMKALARLEAAWHDYSEHFELSGEELAFDCSVRAANYLIGRLRAHEYVDFTKWTDVAAQFAGCAITADEKANGLYVLGAISMDWTGNGDNNGPGAEHRAKSGRAYVKYVNSKPFDSIVDFTVTNTDKGWAGTLVQQTSRQLNSWRNLSYHLVHSSDKQGNPKVYLCVSADGLANSNSDYSNLHFYVTGENFIPLGSDAEQMAQVQGVSENVIATDNLDSALTQGINANRVIDFVDWVAVDAAYVTSEVHVNTGIPIPDVDETGAPVNEHFVIGKLSGGRDYFSDSSSVKEYAFTKPCTVYIKHVGTTNSPDPFEAMVNCTVERTVDADGNVKWKGTVDPRVSRGDGKWRNISFHLEAADDMDIHDEVYLSVSADGLDRDNVVALKLFVCGINFRPLGLGYSKVATKTICFRTANCDRIVYGTGEEDGIYFTSRPIAPVMDGDEISSAPLATLPDLYKAAVPVGGVVEWPHFEEKTKGQVIDEGLEEEYKEHYGELWDTILDDSEVVSRFAVNVPDGYLPCDGREFTAEEYPELVTVLTDKMLPLRDMAIVRVTLYTDGDVANPSVAETLTHERLNQKINAETAARKEADHSIVVRMEEADRQLQKNIDDEAEVRANADNTLKEHADAADSALAAETEAREAGDSALSQRADEADAKHESDVNALRDDMSDKYDTLDTALSQEEASRKALDVRLTDALAREAEERVSGDEAIGVRIDTEVTAFNERATKYEEALAEETENRRHADKVLQDNIDAEADSRVTVTSGLQDQVNKIISDLDASNVSSVAFDKMLSGRIDSVEADVSGKYAATQAADAALQGSIDDVADNLATEAAERKSADSVLGSRTSALETGLIDEETARRSADSGLDTKVSALQSALDAEATARASMDTQLRTEIADEAYLREKNDTILSGKFANAVAAEAATRKDADDDLKEDIETVATNIVQVDQRVDAVRQDLTDLENAVDQLGQ